MAQGFRVEDKQALALGITAASTITQRGLSTYSRRKNSHAISVDRGNLAPLRVPTLFRLLG